MRGDRELEISKSGYELAACGHVTCEAVLDAVDDASDQDKTTWLTRHGKIVAAIVPQDVAHRGDLLEALR